MYMYSAVPGIKLTKAMHTGVRSRVHALKYVKRGAKKKKA